MIAVVVRWCFVGAEARNPICAAVGDSVGAVGGVDSGGTEAGVAVCTESVVAGKAILSSLRLEVLSALKLAALAVLGLASVTLATL